MLVTNTMRMFKEKLKNFIKYLKKTLQLFSFLANSAPSYECVHLKPEGAAETAKTPTRATASELHLSLAATIAGNNQLNHAHC